MPFKGTKTILFVVLGAILLNSCNKDETHFPNNDKNAVKFTSTLGATLKTSSPDDSSMFYPLAMNVAFQSSSTSQSQYELVYSDSSAVYNKNSGTVTPWFRHAISKIIIKFMQYIF